MNVSVNELLVLLGQKEVELYMLQKQLAPLAAEVDKMREAQKEAKAAVPLEAANE